MTRQLVDERPTTVDPQAGRRSGDRRPMEWADLWNAFPSGTWVAAAAAVRGALVALSGMVVTVSLAIVIWAITPQSGDDAAAALHAGFAALAAANLLPISIGGVSFTLPPLLITLLLGILLASSARRGRLLPAGRAQEVLASVVGGGVYGLLVLVVTRGLGPDGVVASGAGPLAVGLLGYGIGTLSGESAWRSWWRTAVPSWWGVALRAGTVGSVALVGGAAAVLAVALGLRFGTALTVADAVAPGGLDGAGLALLQLLYLPNAVLATVGFSSGAGVQVGPGSYLPWGSSAAELPGVPLLAALPTGSGPSPVMAVLLLPVLAAALLAWTVVRSGLTTRLDRVLAAGTGAVAAAAMLGGAAFAAGGGVGDGRWAVIGAPALVVGAAVAVVFGVVGVTTAGLVGLRTVPWRPARSSGRTATRRPRTRSSAGSDDHDERADASSPDDQHDDQPDTGDDHESDETVEATDEVDGADVDDADGATAGADDADEATAEVDDSAEAADEVDETVGATIEGRDAAGATDEVDDAAEVDAPITDEATRAPGAAARTDAADDQPAVAPPAAVESGSDPSDGVDRDSEGGATDPGAAPRHRD